MPQISYRELHCIKCDQDFPSQYWFAAPSICIKCYPLLPETERLKYGAISDTSTSDAQHGPFPSFFQAIGILISLYLLSSIVSLVAVALGASSGFRLFVTHLLSTGGVLATTYIIKHREHEYSRLMFSTRRPRLRFMALFTLLGPLVFFAAACIGGSVISFFGKDLLAPYLVHLPFASPFFIFTAIVSAPILEELLHRRIILEGFLGRFSAHNAIILSTLVFALCHPGFNFLLALILGVFLGWAYWLTRSVITTMLMHFSANATGTILNIYLNIHTELMNKQPTVSVAPGDYALFIMVICSVAGISIYLHRHVDVRRGIESQNTDA
jgi:membrane protease YdiL (CAAX protease family)